MCRVCCGCSHFTSSKVEMAKEQSVYKLTEIYVYVCYTSRVFIVKEVLMRGKFYFNCRETVNVFD